MLTLHALQVEYWQLDPAPVGLQHWMAGGPHHPHHRLHLHVWPRQGAGSDLRGRSWRDLRGFAFPRGNYEIYSYEEWMLPAWVEETLTLTARHTSNQLVKSPHAASRISSLPDKRHPRKEDNALGIFHSQSLPSWSLPQERCVHNVPTSILTGHVFPSAYYNFCITHIDGACVYYTYILYIYMCVFIFVYVFILIFICMLFIFKYIYIYDFTIFLFI